MVASSVLAEAAALIAGGALGSGLTEVAFIKVPLAFDVDRGCILPSEVTEAKGHDEGYEGCRNEPDAVAVLAVAFSGGHCSAMGMSPFGCCSSCQNQHLVP